MIRLSTDLISDLGDKPGAVHDAFTAISILAVVCRTRQKLRKQVAMSGMQLNAVETSTLEVYGSVNKGSFNMRDII
jgi:hypothetical protein